MDNNFEKKIVQDFILEFRDIITDAFKQANLNVEKYYDGLITSYDATNNVATVVSGNLQFENIPNKTAETLAVNDAVRVRAATQTLTDAYIGVKLN